MAACIPPGPAVCTGFRKHLRAAHLLPQGIDWFGLSCAAHSTPVYMLIVRLLCGLRLLMGGRRQYKLHGGLLCGAGRSTG